MNLPKNVIPIEELGELCEKLRSEGKKVVSTNGVFDILHHGHVTYLAEARALGDVLIVGVNSDASVKQNKGPLRPIMGEKERAALLASLKAVDYVTIFNEVTAHALIETIAPHVHTKGGDYTKDQIPEREVIEKTGELVILPESEGRSTTAIIEKIQSIGKE